MHILAIADQNGTVSDQIVASRGPGIHRVARHRHHLAPLIEGRACGDHRSRFRRPFDNDNSARQTGYDPVSLRKMPGLGVQPHRHFRQAQAAMPDLGGQFGGFLGINHINAPGLYRDRAGRQCCFMGGGVYATGQARDDDIPQFPQIPRQAHGHAPPHRRGISRPDKRNRWPQQQRRIALGPQDRRRIGKIPQRRRVVPGTKAQ